VSASATLLCVDAGTTNTRAWLVSEGRIQARREAAVGARDTARDGHDGALRQGLRRLIADVRSAGLPGRAPLRRIAAAGMITSPQGLVEVPHLVAPAGLAELARGARELVLEDVSDLPFLFVPGVRTEARPAAPSALAAMDVMRGEETLCVGLVARGLIEPGGALLNVGSHWKLIRIDERGRVAWSVTSLSGEMIRAVRDDTILASSLPEGPLADPDVPRLLEGFEEARRSGLARALFCVRLLHLGGATTPQQRLSFVVGAFVGADLEGLQADGLLSAGTLVTISGGDKVGGAWQAALEQIGCPARAIGPAEIEAAFVAGLEAIVEIRS
jgi:2-dehydro-3-deoxygalactonokinase